MTYTLSADQLTDLQGDLDLLDDESVFTDEQLNRYFTRAEGDYAVTKVLAGRRLLASLAKKYNYTVGQTSHQKQQLFANGEKLLDRWEREAGMSGGTLSTGTISLGLDATCEDGEF